MLTKSNIEQVVTKLAKQQVVTKLAQDKVIERLVAHRVSSPYAKDLCQDLYIELLGKDESLIVGLYERGEIEYYIRKMISNNVTSKTSRFYRNYERLRKTSSELRDEKTKEVEG